MTKLVPPAGKVPRLYLDVVQPITSGGATHVDSLLVVCGVNGDPSHPDPRLRTRVPMLTRRITLADFEIQRRTPAGATRTGSRWWSAVRKLQLAFANTIGRTIKVSDHSSNDPANDVKRWAVESAISRKRMQCERNALALARLRAGLVQSTTKGEANALSHVIHSVPKHGDRDGLVTVKGVKGVESTLSFHGSSGI